MKNLKFAFFIVIMLISACNVVDVVTPTFEPSAQTRPISTLENPSPAPVTPTLEIPESPPPLETPAGFKRYQDTVIGVSIFIPESWTVIVVDLGRLAILQSYSEGKYTGGEAFQSGDTKCDLTIRPPGIKVISYIQQLKSDSAITITSEKEIVLQSGQPGTRFEVTSMGGSLSVVTKINDRTIVLTCFGDLSPFDQIAYSLNGVSYSATNPTPTAPSTATCAIRKDWYEHIVSGGDTLFNISQRSGSSVDELVSANCLEDPSRISVGQKLYIPNQIPVEDAPTDFLKFYLIIPEDNGRSGPLVGCGDSAIAVWRDQIQTGSSTGDIHSSLDELFSIKTMIYGQSGYVHSLYESNLTVEQITIEEGVAVIELAGTLPLVGTCGDARMEAQILHTVFQYSGFDRSLIFVNGVNLKQLFDVSGNIGSNEPYQNSDLQ